MTVKRRSVNDAEKRGTRPKPITSKGTLTTVDKALAGRMYSGLRRTNVVATLAKLNIPFPAELPDITASEAFPIKITDVEDRALGDLHSYWGAQFARTNALFSIARAERKRLDRVVKRREKIVFRRYAPSSPRSTFVDKVWGDVYAHVLIAKLEKRLDGAEALETVLEGLVKDFNTYLEIIRSEMMFRMSERKATNG
jgi:hypothetical protein